ncbi:MAG: hypothetical protein K2V38_27795, partial [Gemmataceae bacterium]|nr:hypothetical protein [Gemmataceae bacterium]
MPVRPFALAAAFAAASLVVAQEPKEAKEAKEAKEPKGPKAADKGEPVPGRKLKKIEGFTFLLSEEAAGVDPAGYDRPPLAVLERECARVNRVLSPKAAEALHKLTIWVDWDDKVPFANGRPGNTVATYSSNTPQQNVLAGRHALQAKTITIHSLKEMTRHRQPKDDHRVWPIFLHELAHAVHDQVLGFDHPGVRAAFEQAMERRLYDRELYATTDNREFFAELSCAYLDTQFHYPHTRADLK